MKTYQVKITIVINNRRYYCQQYLKGKSYATVTRRAIEWYAKTCPLDFEDVTQIAVRVKRKLR